MTRDTVLPECLKAAGDAYTRALVAQHKLDPTKRRTYSAECMAAALAAVAPAIAAQEREACARVAQQTGYELENLDERNGAFAAVAAIRARGEVV